MLLGGLLRCVWVCWWFGLGVGVLNDCFVVVIRCSLDCLFYCGLLRCSLIWVCYG